MTEGFSDCESDKRESASEVEVVAKELFVPRKDSGSTDDGF